ncbi:hypothetical protein NL676_036092 [Syzygium grande]|nr:hypothetical protein NL676_036092 [Syzygium grande]
MLPPPSLLSLPLFLDLRLAAGNGRGIRLLFSEKLVAAAAGGCWLLPAASAAALGKWRFRRERKTWGLGMLRGVGEGCFYRVRSSPCGSFYGAGVRYANIYGGISTTRPFTSSHVIDENRDVVRNCEKEKERLKASTRRSGYCDNSSSAGGKEHGDEHFRGWKMGSRE